MAMSASTKYDVPLVKLGESVDTALSEAVSSVTISESTQGLYRSEIEIRNWGLKPDSEKPYPLFDRSDLKLGAQLEVKRQDATLFRGRISGLEARYPDLGAPPTLVVLAEDRLQDLRMERRTVLYQGDSSIFDKIAQRHGLKANVKVDPLGSEHQVQANQSDLAFLRERARAVGAELWVEGQDLYIWSRDQRGKTTVDLHYRPTRLHDSGIGRLSEFTVLADLAGQRAGVAVGFWNTENETGPEIVAMSVAPERSAKKGKEILAHAVPFTHTEAKARAQAHLRLIEQRFIVGQGVAEPTAKEQGQLRVGNLVKLRGLGKIFDGTYYLAEVQHRFNSSGGWRCGFTGERDRF